MCEHCGTECGAGQASRRRKLWEIDGRWHCTIIGTCLTMEEIIATASKSGVKFSAGRPSQYDLHSGVVHLAGHRSNFTKALTKQLDRKFVIAVNRAAKAKDEAALKAFWEEARANAEIAGACWALMSHHLASEDLCKAVFGEIHMLSHAVGASARAEQRQILGLERDKAQLEERLRAERQRFASETARRDSIIRELTARVDGLVAETRQLARDAAGMGEAAALKNRLAEIERDLKSEQARRLTAEAELRLSLSDRRDLELRLADLADENGELAAEARAVESRFSGAEQQCDCVGDCAACDRLDLCGRCILVVGGRNQHLPHLKRLVEQAGGSFIHHDGGLEESINRLQAMFGRADAVLFPIDAISHVAHDEIKRLCRRWQKPFVPMKRSGLGAFVRALETVAAQPSDLTGLKPEAAGMVLAGGHG